MTRFCDYGSRDEYRRLISQRMTGWRIEHKETELFICADAALKRLALEAVVSLRSQMDAYIRAHPAFAASLVPVEPLPDAPPVILNMCRAAKAAGVGPMAAVAGAFAEHVGNEILKHAKEVIVENGGDIFMSTDTERTVAVYAGQSPLSLKIGLIAEPGPVSICTSSGTVGPSLSFGHADAAAVVARDACLADACATRLGNEIASAEDISRALDMIARIPGVTGAVAVAGGSCGAVGHIRLKAL